MLFRSAAVLVAVFLLTGAKWNTRNFTVEAPSEQLAERMGQWAEYYRKAKAVEWLGSEMPPWPQRCPLQIKVTFGSSGGATSFDFRGGVYLPIGMEVEGKMDRIVSSVLPHEVTHTVMAHYFGRPVPRWADEGGAVLSEDEQERQQHEGEVRRIIGGKTRAIPLRRLFGLKEYPRDMIVLYAEGYSVSSLLVSKSSRGAFLAFVADGMGTGGWDRALQTHYRIRSVEALEEEWLATLAKPAARDTALVAGPRRAPAAAATTSGGSVAMRTTLPPAMPILGTPRVSTPALVRGAMPEDKKPEGYAAPAEAPPSGGVPAAGVKVGVPRVSNPGFSRD